MTRPQKLTLLALLALSCGCAAQIPDDVYLTNHDVFDLTCAGATPADTRVLHVDIDARGQFAISFVEGGERTHVDARTYTNAITWTQGGDPWMLDRFTGTLSSKAANQRLVCERTGGRKF